ncbi:MAG: sulfite exporter TauE/SafE family protein [Planctomycetota bacterium]
MTPIEFAVLAFLASIAAGVFGSLLGLGGGIIVVPALTLLFGIDIHFAIGASIVAVIATSSGAAATYVRERLANMRVAMVLELSTVLGALTGAELAAWIPGSWLYIIFAAAMFYSSMMMFRKRHSEPIPLDRKAPIADWLNLSSSYFDETTGKEVSYRVIRARIGLLFGYIAGMLSGLLGIGGGAIKVPTMDLAMRMPMKAATATSNFMIGVTAAASAGVYFMKGQINPIVAAPVALGVLIGALFGSKLLGRIQNKTLRAVFVAVLLIISVRMLVSGIQLGLGTHPQ